MQEAGKCWERGRLVRIQSDAGYSRIEDNQRFSRFALSADGDIRVPSNQLTDSFWQSHKTFL